jgi:hypothetical protein
MGMRNSIKTFWAGAIALVLSLPYVLAAQKPQWKGKVEIENGIKVIKNPEKPLYGEIKYELEEDLQIGKEDDDNYVFERIYDVKVDDEGNIFVLDSKAGRIQKYDKSGKYLQTIGRKGQGPGEFEMPFDMFIQLKTGSLCVRDTVRIKIFDKSGQYQKEAILRNFPSEFAADDDGNFWVTMNKRTEKESLKAFEKINLKGDTLLSIANFPYEIYSKRTSETSAISVITGFEHDLHFSKVDENLFIYGYSEKYELNVVDKQGKRLFKIIKDESAQSFEAGEKKGPVGANLPSYKPFFYSIFTDDSGRIYVLKSNITAGRGKTGTPNEYDIYSKDGYFLYKTTLLYGRAFCIKNGCLYARKVLEDTGLEVIKRFKIKNWNSIKNSAEGVK